MATTYTDNLNLQQPDLDDDALITVINNDMAIIDKAVNGVQDGLAIVANGNTHVAISAGQFVYVRNHTTLTEGLYVASTNIAANATLSTSNLTADAAGGLNALNSNLTSLTEPNKSSNLIYVTTLDNGSPYSGYGWCCYRKYGNHVYVHLGLQGLTPNTSQAIFTLPSGYRPYNACWAVGIGGETLAAIARIIVQTNGVVRVISDDHYCGADFEFVVAD